MEIMIQAVVFGYIGIGVILAGCLLLSSEVRADVRAWEPLDLAAFLSWQVMTWPETVYAILFTTD